MHGLEIPQEVVRKVECPQCGFLFSEMHSRAIACMGCSRGVLGDCGFIRCPRCDYEIPRLKNDPPIVDLKEYYDQFGWSYKR